MVRSTWGTKQEETARTYLVEEVVLVDVAAVREDAEVAARAVDEDGLELPGLVVGALVRVEAQIPQPLEVRLCFVCVGGEVVVCALINK